MGIFLVPDTVEFSSVVRFVRNVRNGEWDTLWIASSLLLLTYVREAFSSYKVVDDDEDNEEENQPLLVDTSSPPPKYEPLFFITILDTWVDKEIFSVSSW